MKTSLAYKKLVNLIKEKYNAKILGAGDHGIALSINPTTVLKITTDRYELEHGEKLVEHKLPGIIPIKKVVIKAPSLGYIVMAKANPLSEEEHNAITEATDVAENYIVNGKTDALRNLDDNSKLQSFMRELRYSFQKADIDYDELDWSSDNIMNYKNNFVLVDL